MNLAVCVELFKGIGGYTGEASFNVERKIDNNVRLMVYDNIGWQIRLTILDVIEQ